MLSQMPPDSIASLSAIGCVARRKRRSRRHHRLRQRWRPPQSVGLAIQRILRDRPKGLEAAIRQRVVIRISPVDELPPWNIADKLNQPDQVTKTKMTVDVEGYPDLLRARDRFREKHPAIRREITTYLVVISTVPTPAAPLERLPRYLAVAALSYDFPKPG
jgi:hypothetical protein